MGLRCSCGALTTPTTTGNIVLSFSGDDQRAGTITFTVDACADRLESSTVSTIFVDQSGMTPNQSFTFNSTIIQEVSCQVVNGNCQVIIRGMGLVVGETTPRQFILAFVDPFVANFTITGFVSNVTSSFVQPAPTFFC